MFRFVSSLNAIPAVRIAVALLLGLVFGIVAPAAGANAGERLALVIGNGNYDKGFPKLEKPVPDADKMASLFTSYGYRVVTNKRDIATQSDFAEAVDSFVKSITPGSEVLIYYSGHGFSGEGASKQIENYFVPTSVLGQGRFDEESRDPQKNSPYKGLKYKEYVFQAAFSQRTLEEKVNAKKPAIIIFFYDHCRETVQKGVELEAATNTVATFHYPSTSTYYIYAAGPNERALEIDLSRKIDSKDKRTAIEGAGLDTKLSIFANALVRFVGKGPIDSAGPVIAHTVYQWTYRFGDGQRQKPHVDGYIPYPYFLDRSAHTGDDCQSAGKELDVLRDRIRKGDITADTLDQEFVKYEGCDEVHKQLSDLKSLMPKREERSSSLIASLPQTQQQVPEGPVGECDLLAASANDPARPKYANGVDLTGLVREALLDSKHAADAREVLDKAVAVCTKATESNARLARPKFNLARAYLAKAKLETGDDARAADLYHATKNYKDAEPLGYIAALNDLGYMYQEGLVVTDLDTLFLNRDPKRAVDYYRRAADLGMPLAQYNIGIIFWDGLLGEKADKLKAYRYLSRAAESGYLPAIIQTAVALWNGAGVDADAERAQTMFKRAADKGSVRAYYLLGWTYENGKDSGGPEDGDPLRGLIWYTRAAELGESDAYEKVAHLLTEAPGLPDTQRIAAARYWRLAADSGSRKATLQLARMLLNSEIPIKPDGGNEPLQRIKSLTDIQYAAGFLEMAKWHQGASTFSNAKDFKIDYAKAVIAAEKAIEISKKAEDSLDARSKEEEAEKKAAAEEEKKAGRGADAKKEQTEAQTKYSPDSYLNTIESENADPRNQFLAAATIFEIASAAPSGEPPVAGARVEELRKLYGAPEKLTWVPFRCSSGSVQIFAAWDWNRDGDMSPLDWQFKWRESPMAWQNTSEKCFVSNECKKRMSEAYRRFKQQKDSKEPKSFASWVIGASDQLAAEISKGRHANEETCKYLGL